MPKQANRAATRSRLWLGIALLGVGLAAYAQQGEHEIAHPAAKALRVCADPHNMPFSNRKRQGFENKIAALFGKKLGVPVKYYFRPTQFGFARITLKKWLPNKNRYACDLIITAGGALDVGKATRPYYRSSFVLAYLKGHGLDSVEKPIDLTKLPAKKLKHLKIGVFAGSPVANWLLEHHLDQHMVSYRAMSGSYDVNPSDMITDALVNGKIDVATIWGPIAGYYAKHDKKAHIVVVPFTKKNGPRMTAPVSMGVRYGNDAWYNKVEGLIKNNHKAIMHILHNYGVPTVALTAEDRKAPEDDDD